MTRTTERARSAGKPHTKQPPHARGHAVAAASPTTGAPRTATPECPTPRTPPVPLTPPTPQPVELLLESRRSLTLRCGKSSITLHANGKIVLRGEYILSDAEGVNRIAGGQIELN